MGFEKGHKHGKGRQKGATGKFKRMIQEKAQKLQISPFDTLLLFAAGDWEALGYESKKYISGATEGFIFEKYTIDPAVRLKAAAEATGYLMPKLKSIEHKQANPLEGMTTQQKIEAMKEAVKLMEEQERNSKALEVKKNE